MLTTLSLRRHASMGLALITVAALAVKAVTPAAAAELPVASGPLPGANNNPVALAMPDPNSDQTGPIIPNDDLAIQSPEVQALIQGSTTQAYSAPQSYGALNVDPKSIDPNGYDDQWLMGPDGNRPTLDSFWQSMLPKGSYTPAGVAWMNEQGGTDTKGCGLLQGTDVLDAGAFYCDKGKTVWLDLSFLTSQITQQYGYVGLAAVEAHEFGHHIQNIYGPGYHGMQSELQADCYAGSYMHFFKRVQEAKNPNDPDPNKRPWLTVDYNRLLQQFGAAGDQPNNPPSHGTGAQRQQAFAAGWASYTEVPGGPGHDTANPIGACALYN
jgi:hypothetical protein